MEYCNLIKSPEALIILSIAIVFLFYLNNIDNIYNPYSWKQMPVIKWEKQDNKWVQVVSYCTYEDYCDDDNYSYKWVSSEQEMCFVQKEPPASCTVMCSDNLKDYVNEILKNTL